MAIKGTILAMIISAYVGGGAYNYARPMEVIKWNNEVLMIDKDGNLWDTKDDIKEGEQVTVILSNEGTATIEDDKIVRVIRQREWAFPPLSALHEAGRDFPVFYNSVILGQDFLK